MILAPTTLPTSTHRRPTHHPATRGTTTAVRRTTTGSTPTTPDNRVPRRPGRQDPTSPTVLHRPTSSPSTGRTHTGEPTGTPTSPTFREALATQAVCDAVLDSAEHKKWETVVPV